MTHDESEEVIPPQEDEKPKGRKRQKKKEEPVPDTDKLGATMADRMDAWKTADTLLNREWQKDSPNDDAKLVRRRWITSDGEEEIVVGPHDVLILATWLLYGVVVED